MERKDMYKQGVESAEVLRERRRLQIAEFRKEKRDLLLRPKRFCNSLPEGGQQQIVDEQQIHDAVRTLKRSPEKRREALCVLKNAFVHSPSLVDVFLRIDNATSAVVGALTSGNAELQLEAACCITNMAAGNDEQAETVVKQIGPYLVTYLNSANSALQDQCAWAVGNLAGGSLQCRDVLRAQGVTRPLLSLLQSPNRSVVQSAVMALCNLARDSSHTRDLVEGGVLAQLEPLLVLEGQDLELLAEVLWLLSYLAACGSYEQEVLQTVIIEKLVAVLSTHAETGSEEYQVVIPALRCVGYLCSGGSAVRQRACSQTGLLAALRYYIQCPLMKQLTKEILWVLANVTVNASLTKEVSDIGLLPLIISALGGNMETKLEAARVVCNIVSHGRVFCELLLETDALKLMVSLLEVPEASACRMAICFWETVLRCTGKMGEKKFRDAGGTGALEMLLYHSDDELRSMADSIIGIYFSEGSR